MAGRDLGRRRSAGSLALLPCLFVIGTTAAEYATPRATVDFSRTVQRAEEQIPALMKKHKVTGLSAVLVSRDRVIWEQGFGYADTRRGLPADSNTLYRLGSASSLWTVLAVLELAERGRIDLAAPVQRYLPGLDIKNRFGSEQVTVRQLLSHHSGLPADVLRGKWAYQPGSFRSLLDHPAAMVLVTRPGSLYVQSAVGMNVLGALIEARTGRSFVDYMHAFIERLGLRESRYLVNEADTALLSQEYRETEMQPRFRPRDLPANGLATSTRELAAFLRLLLTRGQLDGQQRVPAAVVDKLWQPRNVHVSLDLHTPFAYGWALGAFEIHGAGPVAHFSGQSLFHQNQIVVVPEQGLAAAVLANSQEARPLVDEVARLLLAGALSDQSGIIQPVPAVPELLEGDEADAMTAGFAGRYATWRGLSQVYKKGRQLRIRLGERELHLVPARDGWFSMQYRLFGMIPISVDALKQIRLKPDRLNGQHFMLARFRGWDFVFGEQVTARPAPALWRHRVGRYRLLNPDDALDVQDLFLEFDDGVLSVSYAAPPFIRDKARFPLVVHSDTRAVVAGLGRHLGQSLWFENSDGSRGENEQPREQMHMSGFVAERIGSR